MNFVIIKEVGAGDKNSSGASH